jgi:hypothetical protein
MSGYPLRRYIEGDWCLASAIPTSPFYLPVQGQAVSGVILKIEWNDVDDPYWRALNAYINGQIVWTDNNNQGLYIAPGSSSVQKDVTNKIAWWSLQGPSWVYNNASVVLTTYAGYGHWDVRAYIYVVYTAATHFISVAANWAQYYNIQTNTQNTIDFPTALPDNTANQGGAEMVYIHAVANNDQWARYLDLYINDVFVQRWMIKGEADRSFDITSYVLGAPNVTIGIQLICGVGTWGIDGNITTLYRPSVAPDFDPFWTSPTNLQTLTSHAGNIYYNYANLNNFAGTFSTETEGFGSSANPYYFYTGLTAAYPPCTAEFCVDYMQTRISIIEPDGHTILPNSAYSYTGFSGSSSGSTEVNPLVNMGVALLTGTSICLSVYNPALGAMLALAALVIRYSPPAPAYSAKTDSTGIEMTYNGPDYRRQSMLLKWSVLWPASGVYTVNIQTTVTMDLGGEYPDSTIVFTDPFLVYVPYNGQWPKLTISASSGGANPPTDPPPGTYTCSYGSCYPVTAYPAAGYSFDHWSLDGNPYSTDATTVVTMTADHSLTAYFNLLNTGVPRCALKTKTDGYFYVPNPAFVNVTVLRVEMVFNDSNLVGDQTGGPSPYPAIANYPDESVDGSDLIIVARSFGQPEGGARWNYMADVVPDRNIDGLDSIAVARNFGQPQYPFNYTYDLTGVNVTFSTGAVELPDANGFVAIPQGATWFNVSRNGTAIGAMIIFCGP